MNLFSRKVSKVEDSFFRKSYFSLVKRFSKGLLEIGAHQGEVAQYFLSHADINVISYEANPFNVEHYELDSIGVRSGAVVPGHEKTITLNIPRRAWQTNDDAHSGKGSVLNRQDGDFDNFLTVSVPCVNINKPLAELKSHNSVWMDCEGLSLPLISSITKENLKNIDFIYAEFETTPVFSGSNTLNDLGDWLIGSPFQILGKARTSHNQYNVILVNKTMQKFHPILFFGYKSIYALFSFIFSTLHPLISLPGKIISALSRVVTKRS